MKFKPILRDKEFKFCIQSIQKYGDKIARFRMTAKMHKEYLTIPPFRPIVCCVGTFMNCWSKWLDVQLSKLIPFVTSHVKDYQQILDETKKLQLTPDAWQFTADANLMFTNILAAHAIDVISWWLDDLYDRGLLPEGFPLEAVKKAMVIIMKNNVFEFGDLHFLQLIVTAMGTSAAVMWATISFAYHKAHCILPKHDKHLLYYSLTTSTAFGPAIVPTNGTSSATTSMTLEF